MNQDNKTINARENLSKNDERKEDAGAPLAASWRFCGSTRLKMLSQIKRQNKAHQNRSWTGVIFAEFPKGSVYPPPFSQFSLN